MNFIYTALCLPWMCDCDKWIRLKKQVSEWRTIYFYGYIYHPPRVQLFICYPYGCESIITVTILAVTFTFMSLWRRDSTLSKSYIKCVLKIPTFYTKLVSWPLLLSLSGSIAMTVFLRASLFCASFGSFVFFHLSLHSVHPPLTVSGPSSRYLPSHLHHCYFLGNILVISFHYMAIQRTVFLSGICCDSLVHCITPDLFVSNSMFPCFPWIHLYIFIVDITPPAATTTFHLTPDVDVLQSEWGTVRARCWSTVRLASVGLLPSASHTSCAITDGLSTSRTTL